MAIYKDSDRGTWYVSCYYKDWTGKQKRHHKRGFLTKKQAVEYEAEFLTLKRKDLDVYFKDFIEIYFHDKENELKQRSIKNKRHMIEKHIIPYFSNKRINQIQSKDIINWQKEMNKKGYKQTYLRMIQNQLSAIFNHAERVYSLKENPCKKVKKMGVADADEMNFWKVEEFEKFLEFVPKKGYYYTIYMLLFWTGMRLGECLALTKEDINFDENQIKINKTFHRENGKDVITTPKTNTSVRIVLIPNFLKQELVRYIGILYKPESTDRLFPISERAVQIHMKRYIEKSGVKKIRVHDLRHSHVAYLIDQGVDPLIIKDRVGHKSIEMTLNTYGHLYPNKQIGVAELLDSLNTK